MNNSGSSYRTIAIVMIVCGCMGYVGGFGHSWGPGGIAPFIQGYMAAIGGAIGWLGLQLVFAQFRSARKLRSPLAAELETARVLSGLPTVSVAAPAHRAVAQEWVLAWRAFLLGSSAMVLWWIVQLTGLAGMLLLAMIPLAIWKVRRMDLLGNGLDIDLEVVVTRAQLTEG